jgi:hypothetical protein
MSGLRRVLGWLLLPMAIVVFGLLLVVLWVYSEVTGHELWEVE